LDKCNKYNYLHYFNRSLAVGDIVEAIARSTSKLKSERNPKRKKEKKYQMKVSV